MSVEIASLVISGWQGGSSVSLRIDTDQTFTSSAGNVWPCTIKSNPASLGTFYQLYACAITGTELTIPQISLDSTVDSVDNPAATYSASFVDTSCGQIIQPFGAGSFSVPPSPSSTTWAKIFAAEGLQNA